MATNQVRGGDWIKADLDSERGCLLFTTEDENLEVHAMANLIGDNVRLPVVAAAAAPQPEFVKTAKSSKK
jgi:hypothetical protein